MKVPAFLAFDLGAASGRALVASLKDDKLVLDEVHRFENKPVSLFDGLYWDVLCLFDEVKTGLGKARRGSEGRGLVSLGIDTWAVDFGLIGRDNTLLGMPRHYRDARHLGAMKTVFEKVPRGVIYEETGIQFLPFNTLYQLFALKESQSPLLTKALDLLMMGELLTFFLTGERVAEFTNATTTQLYNPRLDRWSPLLFERLNLPLGIMPEIVPPGTMIGPVLDSVGEETGAKDIPVVVPAVHDTGSAVAAVPAKPHTSWCFLSSGTWSLLGVEVPEPVITPSSMAYNVTNEGGVFGTYRLLKNVMGLWILQACQQEWVHRSAASLSWERLLEEARDAPSFGQFIDPDADVFLTPGPMVARIQKFCKDTGQHVPTDRGEIVRTVLESLALKYRVVLEQLETLIGRKLDIVHVVGGGSQNALLNQMTANATKKVVTAGPVEATAIGNVLMQMIAGGHLGSIADGRALVQKSFRLTTFQPKGTDAWDEAYGRFRAILSP